MANFIINRSMLPANEKTYKQVFASLNPQDGLSEAEKSEKLRELFATVDGRQQLASLRTEVVNLKVRANMIGMDFFQLIELRPDEVPAYEIEAETANIPITAISNLGGSAVTVYSDSLGRATFPLGMMESDWVKCQRMDLVQGFVDRSEKINQKISESLANKLDDMALVARDAAFGAFDANVWLLDPKIKNAPTTNDIDLSTDCAGKFTKDAIKGIAEHFDRIGKPVRALYVPAARKHDLLDWVSVSGTDITAGATVPAAVQEEIWRTGKVTGSLIPPIVFSNVLEGETAEGIYCYAVTDQPAGYFFQKPAFHLTDEKIEGMFYQAKTLVTGSFVIPPYRRMNIARFKLG